MIFDEGNTGGFLKYCVLRFLRKLVIDFDSRTGLSILFHRKGEEQEKDFAPKLVLILGIAFNVNEVLDLRSISDLR